jgi:sec-independent protein translocase protein TatA
MELASARQRLEEPMGNIGVTEVLLIAVVALLLFGAGRIADIGKGLGQGIKNFKQGLKEAGELDDDKKDASKDDKEAKAKEA